MVLHRKRRRGKALPLPWEQRADLLRELLSGPRWKVALLVVAVAATIGITWRAADRHARYRETRAAIAQVHRALHRFRVDMGRCPRLPGELLHPPRAGAHYLRRIPSDGWGRQLFTACPSRYDTNDEDVVSAGPSGSFFVDDNVR